MKIPAKWYCYLIMASIPFQNDITGYSYMEKSPFHSYPYSIYSGYNYPVAIPDRSKDSLDGPLCIPCHINCLLLYPIF